MRTELQQVPREPPRQIFPSIVRLQGNDHTGEYPVRMTMMEDLTPIKLICLITLPNFKGGMKVYKTDVPRKTPVFPDLRSMKECNVPAPG